MRLSISFVFAAIALLNGCETVRYEFQPPATASGRSCITHCAAIRETCRGNEIARANAERQACQRSSDQAFRLCMGKAAGKDQEKACEKKKSGCYASENGERCDEDHRQCYAGCGGTVTKIIEK